MPLALVAFGKKIVNELNPAHARVGIQEAEKGSEEGNLYTKGWPKVTVVLFLGRLTIITSEIGCCCIHLKDLTFLTHQTCARVAYPPYKPFKKSGSVTII
jgi:hypothetical protein